MSPLAEVSPSAKVAKDHFVIVDAIDVTKSLKTDSRPLEPKKSGVALKDLLDAIAVGARDEELFLLITVLLFVSSKSVQAAEKVLDKNCAFRMVKICFDMRNVLSPFY